MMKQFFKPVFFLLGTLVQASLGMAAEADAWLADLKGLPTQEVIEKLSERADKMMAKEKDKICLSVNDRLRKMIFVHFLSYQYMLNQRGIYLHEDNAAHWAKVFGMLLLESSGDTTNISSMTGLTYTTHDATSDLARWRAVANLSKNSEIPLNYQTNFGLTQLSVDRLFVALKLALDPAYLKGRKIDDLNTAIAIRKLLWFYQDFAQGRLADEHDRIHEGQQGNPEYSTRFSFGISTALLLCGTNYMFYEGYHDKATGAASLTDAMASIAYCKIGDDKAGYVIKEENEKCFAQWVTLCPALNFDIAMLTPMKYFQTRNAAPVCEGAFNALLNKKSFKLASFDADAAQISNAAQMSKKKPVHSTPKLVVRIKRFLN